ncbi:hypothetical protein [Streptomyces sp. NPDC048442]|uniref:hypothetical protein n=1 Tax=Streptomyces sp. NPDC048442 TaxID=3154823 RepID=UPI00343BDD10
MPPQSYVQQSSGLTHTAQHLPRTARRSPARRATLRCGLYYAYTSGNTLYAWQHNDDHITFNKAAAGH